MNSTVVPEPENLNIPTLYKYMNTIYQESINNKKNCATILKKIFELTNRVNDIEQNYLHFKADIAGRVLGNELKIEKIDKTKEPDTKAIHKKINENNNRIEL